MKSHRWIAACTAALLLAGCGGDDNSASEDTDAANATTVDATSPSTAVTTGTSGSATSAPSTADVASPPEGDLADPVLPSDNGLQLDAPIQITLLAEVPGESPVALPWSNDGAQLAVDDLNEAGGFGGHPIEMERIPAPVLDPAASQTAVLRAIDQNPTAIVGLQATAQSLQANDAVGDGGIPLLNNSTADQILASHPESISNPFSFLQRLPQTALAQGLTAVALDDLNLQKLALFCTDDPFGTNGCNAAQAAVEDAGQEIVERVTAAATATDFTSQVLELQSAGADGVIAFIYPAALPTFLDQLADNGFDIPVLSSSASLRWHDTTTGNLENLYGVEDCVPEADPRPAVQDWVKRYEERFGYTPTYQSAEHYDAVMLVADAVQRAGSTDHAAVRDALASTSLAGVCGTYEADDVQGLLHTAVSMSFTDDGPVFGRVVELGEFTFAG